MPASVTAESHDEVHLVKRLGSVLPTALTDWFEPLAGRKRLEQKDIEELLQAAQMALTESKVPAASSLATGPLDDELVCRLLILAHLAHEYAKHRRIQPKHRNRQQLIAKAILPVLPRFVLWMALAKARQHDAKKLVCAPPATLDVFTLAAEFERAIAPQRLRTAIADEKFLARVSAYLQHRSQSEDGFRTWLSNSLTGEGRLSQEKADFLMSRMPLVRWRTYSQPHLLEIVQFSKSWGGVVRYLCDPAFRGKCDRNHPGLSALAEKVTQKFFNSVRAAWPNYSAEAGPDDLLQEALTRAMEDYAFDCPFDRWLLRVAINFLRDELEKGTPNLVDGDETPAPNADDADPKVLTGLFTSWESRYAVVRKTFRPKTRPEIDIIFEDFFRQATGKPESTLAELAKRISDRLKLTVPTNGNRVGGQKRKLRRRLEVPRFVIDVTARDPKPPINDEVLAWIKKKYGKSAGDDAILKDLAEIARYYRRTGKWPP